MRRASTAKVSSIIAGNHWRWQYGRSAVVREIERATPNSFLPNVLCEDSIRWLLSPSGIFSIKTVWNAFRFSAPEVDWHKVVWFKHHVPRWAIVQWLCILGRLATRDRLFRWGVIDCATCVLCTNFDESHEHLFFGCPFSTSVWQYSLVKNSIHRPCFPLLNEIQWINVHRGGANLQTLLVKLSCAAVVYHLWRERNRPIFQGVSSTPDQIISVVASDIRGYVSSWKNIRKSDVNRLLCLTWNVSSKVFVNSKFLFVCFRNVP